MYKLITGRTPFQANNALEMMHRHRYARFDAPNLIVPEIPQALNDLICRLLEKEPEKRPPDALVLARELESLRRRATHKSQITTDMGADDATVAEQSTEVANAEPRVGPATLMSQLMRKELEEMNREGPIGRMLNRAWLLVLLLGLIIGAIVYGLWPKEPEAILQEAETLVARGEWRDAAAKLDRLDRKHPEHDLAERVQELRKQIADGQAARQALRGSGATAASPPVSEAERFYREALLDFQAGRGDRARQRWQQLIEAFSGIEAEKQWVTLAQDGLKKATTSENSGVDEAIRLAKRELPAQGRKRLQALAALYSARDEEAAKAALAKIAAALQELDVAANGGK
jgi:serine/threonine-protein kinase